MASSLNDLLVKLGLESAQFQSSLERAQIKVRQFSANSQKYLQNIDSAMTTLNKSSRLTNLLLSVEAVKNGLSGFVSYADSYTEIANKMRLVKSASMSASTGLEQIFTIATKTNQSVQATSDVYQRFAQNAQALGISQAQVASLTETVSKAVAVSGASAASAQAALMQFGQSLASGVFRGQEFNSVMEQTPGLAQAIARGLGVTTGELRKMANDGKLTMDVLIPALERAKASVDAQFNTRVVTLSASFENLKTATTQWLGEVNESAGVTSTLGRAVEFLSGNLDTAARVAATFGLALGVTKIRAYIAANTAQRAATIAAAEAELARAASLTRLEQQQMSLLQLQRTHITTNSQLLASDQLIAAQKAKLTTAISAQAAAQARLNTVQGAAKTGGALLNGALGMVGGVWGLVAIGAVTAASAVYEYYEEAERAREQSLDFAKQLDVTAESLNKMSQTELLVNRDKLKDSIQTQVEKLKKLRAEYERLKEASENSTGIAGYDSFSGQAIEFTRSTEEMTKAREKARAKALEVEQAEKTLAESREKLGLISDEAFNIEAQLNAELEKTGQVITGTDPKVNQLAASLDDAGMLALSAVPNILAYANAVAQIGDAAIIASSQINGLKNQLGDKAQSIVNKANRQAAISKEKDPGKKAKLRAEDYFLSLSDNDKFTEAEKNAIISAKEAEYLAGATVGKSKKGGSKTDYVKQYTDQLTGMQQRLAELKANARDIDLFGQPSQYQEVNKLTQDIAANAEKYKNFGVEGIAKLKDMAAQIDSANQQVAISQFTYDHTQELEQMQFEFDLLGKTSQEQEKLTYFRKIDLEAKRLSVGMSAENVAKLNAETEAMKKQYEALMKQQEARKGSVTAGLQDGWKSIEADVTDVAGNVKNITVDAFNSMSDALTDFATTGKADFSDMASSILKDISSMIIKIMLFNTLKSALGGTSFGSLFGLSGGGAVGQHYKGGLVGFDSGGFTGLGGKYTPAGIVHRGEYVLTKEATSRLGIGYLDYLNYSTTRGFAGGGGVSVPKVPSTNYQSAVRSGEVSVKVINNGEQVDANVSKKQNGNDLEITIELMRKIAKTEANTAIQDNFRARGAFSRGNI